MRLMVLLVVMVIVIGCVSETPALEADQPVADWFDG